MLNTLKFTLTVPTAFHFMSRYLKAAGGDKQMELVASFLVRAPSLRLVPRPAHVAGCPLQDTYIYDILAQCFVDADVHVCDPSSVSFRFPRTSSSSLLHDMRLLH